MTLTYGFYDSISSDRLYNAKQMGRIFDGLILDGVYVAIGDKFIVLEDTGMDVSVGTGRAWFDHTWTYNDAAIGKTIATADPVLNRIDIIYLEVNENVGVRANSIAVLTGTPASSPVPPDLTDTSSIHQYALAHIYVAASVTEILQADITNMVGTDDTPYVELVTESEDLQAQIWDIVGDTNPPLIDIIALKAHDHDGSPTVQIDTAGLAADAVDDSKIGNRVIGLANRQGGSAIHWDNVGVINYVPTGVRMQVGSIQWTGAAAASGNKAIVFPVAFSYSPIVFLNEQGYITKITFSVSPTTNMCTVYWRTTDASTITELDILWMAIGPE